MVIVAEGLNSRRRFAYDIIDMYNAPSGGGVSSPRLRKTRGSGEVGARLGIGAPPAPEW